MELIEVPEIEFETVGTNVLAIAPWKCVIVAGNPVTELRLRDAGCSANKVMR